MAFAAGWLSFVLLGRILFAIGLRDAFRDTRRELPLATFAVAAMAVSVAIEVIDYALVTSGAWLAHAHGAASAIVALDTAGTILYRHDLGADRRLHGRRLAGDAPVKALPALADMARPRRGGARDLRRDRCRVRAGSDRKLPHCGRHPQRTAYLRLLDLE